jgi:U3 small nucleolar RNA-associated protein 10
VSTTAVMATAFAQQLRQIAAHSTNELDLRARRDAHAESLLFERSVAIKQDWDTLYQICVAGFEELCALDARLQDFGRSLFSAQSKDQDREQLNKAQNEDLDNAIDQCLQMLAPRLTLRPGLQALEWLIRRFQIHRYNVRNLLLTALPYHDRPLFKNVMSIIAPGKLVDEWKFLRPYHKVPDQVPRHVIVYAATNNNGFFSAFNDYALRSCHNQVMNSPYMRFWSGAVLEAVAARLDQAKSGRKEIQRNRVEDVLHKILPILNEGLSNVALPELTLTCSALALVLASTGMIDDSVLDTLMDSVANSMFRAAIDQNAALVALAVLAAQKSELLVPRLVLKALMQLEDFASSFIDIAQEYPCQNLFLSVVRTVLKLSKKRNPENRLAFLRRVFDAGPQLASDTKRVDWLIAVVSEIQQQNIQDVSQATLRSRLLTLVQELHESGTYSASFTLLVPRCQASGLDLEDLLQSAISTAPTTSESQNDHDMEEVQESGSAIEVAFSSLPEELPVNVRFLTARDEPVLRQLLDVLQLCSSPDDLTKFVSHSIWTQSDTARSSYVAFLLRVLLSDHSINLRNSAAQLLRRHVRTLEVARLSSLIPYLTVLLTDPMVSLRSAVSTILFEAHDRAESDSSEEAPNNDLELYGSEADSKVSTISRDQIAMVLQQVYIPNLEEFKSDPTRISLVLQHALNGTIDKRLSSASGVELDLKRNVRQAMLECLSSHAIETPCLRLKLGVVRILKSVTKAGSLKKGDALMPLLRQWALLNHDEVVLWVRQEHLSLADADSTMASLVTARDSDSIGKVLSFVEAGKFELREDLVTAVFTRIAQIWPDIAEEFRQALATKLYDLSLTENSTCSRNARATLLDINLSTEVLRELLEHAMSGSQEMQEQPPAKKQRRSSSSHGGSRPSQETISFRLSLPRLALALEVVDGSKPESRPALLSVLMETLLFLRRAKMQLGAESPYLLTMCLSILHAIIEKLRTARKPNLDWTSIRADLVVDCVRTSESPQVQTEALMLSASLAAIAPDKIIHHIMPVFTFMGNKILSQEDQHSVNVVNQAIDEIVPPIVASLKKQDAHNIYKSTKSLLSSFVAAFNHIPDQRKVPLFQRLLRQLGPEEFGVAIVAMLSKTEGVTQDLTNFMGRLFAEFQPTVYLSTFKGLVLLAADIRSSVPHNAQFLLDINAQTSATDKEAAELDIMNSACALFDSKSIRVRLAKAIRKETSSRVAIEELFRTCLQSTLQYMKAIGHAQNPQLQVVTKLGLEALLELVSLKQFIEGLPALLADLDESDSVVRPRAIRLLSSRMPRKGSWDGPTSAAALDLLGHMEHIVTTTNLPALKFAAIECIDSIVSKFGRRDTNTLVSPAFVLAGEHCLTSSDDVTRTVSAYALGSMLDVVQEASVPVIPGAFDGAMALIKDGIAAGANGEELHNAGWFVVQCILSTVGFMVSDENLDLIITAAAQASASDLPKNTDPACEHALQAAATRLEIASLADSLSRTWKDIVDYGPRAVMPSLRMFDTAIQHHPKDAVVRSSEAISAVFLGAFDLRRLQASKGSSIYTPTDLTEIESNINAIAIHFVYKLSDATFRPIYANWIEWATSARDLPSPADNDKLNRQTSMAAFQAHFFTELKQIVTSYATYLLPLANTILPAVASTTEPTDHTTPILHHNILAALAAAATHDETAFFSIPSHFNPLAANLIGQLHLASHKSTRPLITTHIQPAIIALATAVQDTPAHHLALNHHLSQLRHATSSHVRMASIRTHIALTEDEEVGDEWVANVVTGSASSMAFDDDDDVDAGGAGKIAHGGGGGSSAETMIYVNEMLEDDDEEVEKEVRRWVRMVRERVGEDIFET